MKRFFRIILFTAFILIALIVLLFGYKDIPLNELKAKYATDKSEFISINGMDVHYRDEGEQSDSIPIVLIHGTGSSLHTFDDWTSQLTKDYRVVRMDIPGYGLTGPFPNRMYTIDHYIEFIKDFLTELDIKKCVLGGNSLGGCIAWRLTLKYPDLVDKLILIDASGYPSKENKTPLAFRIARTPVINNIFKFITPKRIARSSVENVYADKSKVTDKIVDRYFELTLRKGNRQAFVDRLVAEVDTSAYKNIDLIEHRTLILWGEDDQLIPVEFAHRFAADLTNDTLVIVHNSGHVPMEENPDKSVVPVISFLQHD